MLRDKKSAIISRNVEIEREEIRLINEGYSEWEAAKIAARTVFERRQRKKHRRRTDEV